MKEADINAGVADILQARTIEEDLELFQIRNRVQQSSLWGRASFVDDNPRHLKGLHEHKIVRASVFCSMVSLQLDTFP